MTTLATVTLSPVKLSVAKPSLLVDSNVLLDIFANDPDWFEWSAAVLGRYAKTHRLCINAMIYAELSIGFVRLEELEHALKIAAIDLSDLPKEALFLAGKVFLSYRRQGGTKTSTLPDFFIGAHAAVQKWPLLTRDVKRYKTYYPTVELITPE